MARRAIISTYDWAQDPAVTISGGSWETNFPATNMLTLQPQDVAQATGSSVSFTVNLGASRSIGLIHLQRLVTGSGGSIQVTAGAYDSTTVNSWATDGSGIYPPLLYASLGRPRIFIPSPVPIVASSVSISISSSGGVPLQIGYVGVCETVQIPGDMLVGNVTGVLDESQVDDVPSGSTFITLRAKRRKLDFGMGGLSEANGDYYRIFDAAVVNGKSSPVVVCKFPDDTFNLERCTLWGTMTNEQSFTNTFYGHCDNVSQLRQLV